YFTITTNTLVALCYTFYGFKGASRIGKWLIRPDSIFAITVFIAIVGLIYHTVLRPLSEFSGFPLLITELLHTVQPIGFMLFWICFISKDGLTWKGFLRSEEHTSELQSRENLVCRLLLEKKK